MKARFKKINLEWITMALLAIPVIFLSFFMDFERESGDNIVHYFFARYAPLQPDLYLDLWAKPIFTLLASPFAQLGFEGMKFFNGLAGWFSALIVMKTSRKLGLSFCWLSPIFLFFAPTYFVLLFSGYTEPLFGLFLVLGFYLLLTDKPGMAALMTSFLPFIRTEGILIIGIIGLYLIWKKEWKSVPWLAAGSLAVSIAGWIAGKRLFWIIQDVPYAVTSNYGSGTLYHYAEQYVLATGIPLAISSIAGILLVAGMLLLGKRPSEMQFRKEYVLLLALFISYFTAHSLFYYFGLFTSYGLIRIIIPLIPLSAVFSIYAFNRLFRLKNIKGQYLAIAFLVYVVIFPFLNNPASLNLDKDFSQKASLNIMQEISEKIQKEYPGHHLYYSEPYLSYALRINHFDATLHENFTEIPDWQMRKPAIVVWDSWTSVAFVARKYDFDQMAGFRLIQTYSDPDNPSEILFKVYLSE